MADSQAGGGRADRRTDYRSDSDRHDGMWRGEAWHDMTWQGVCCADSDRIKSGAVTQTAHKVLNFQCAARALAGGAAAETDDCAGDCTHRLPLRMPSRDRQCSTGTGTLILNLTKKQTNNKHRRGERGRERRRGREGERGSGEGAQMTEN
jgi:hypothetical protein